MADRPHEAPPAGPDPAGGLAGELQQARPRLVSMVRLRLDPQLQQRLDASDIVQEALVDAVQRLPEYESAPALSPYLWVRQLVLQKLVDARRRHRARKRDVRREQAPATSEVSVQSLGRCLLAGGPSPSTQVRQREEQERMRSVLEDMPELEREIIAMRHFEALNNKETALALGVSEATASRGYVKALERLRRHLDGHAGR